MPSCSCSTGTFEVDNDIFPGVAQVHSRFFGIAGSVAKVIDYLALEPKAQRKEAELKNKQYKNNNTQYIRNKQHQKNKITNGEKIKKKKNTNETRLSLNLSVVLTP